MQLIYRLPLKGVDFHGVDAMGFLKDFVVLKCLFAYVDFWKSDCLKRRIMSVLIFYLEKEPFLLKGFFQWF